LPTRAIDERPHTRAIGRLRSAKEIFTSAIKNIQSSKTYGALGGIVVFLVWLWISNTVILLGAELNAEIERGRQIEAGAPAEREPFLEPRDQPS
jgi:membrane protein